LTRPTRSAFFWFLLMLAAGEAFAWWALPYRRVPKADATIRNPLETRAWPEYLDVDDAGDARPLVVLISASQGVAPEIADKNKIYAAALRDHLAREGFRFENWSTPGMRTTELELLFYEAIARRARHVLLLSAVPNFDPPEKVNLSFPFSDIVLLAGEPALWQLMRGALFMRRSGVEDVLAAFALLHSGLARSRFAITDAVAARIPLAAHRFVFGREVHMERRLDEATAPGFSLLFAEAGVAEQERLARQAANAANPRDRKLGDVAARFETFSALLPRLQERAAEAGLGVTWVWLPVAYKTGSPETLAENDGFVARATPMIEASGFRCHDLVRAIDAERFLTAGHLDEAGQRELAGLLIPIVDADIAQPGKAP
jgi:hypothetical protein